MNEHEEMMTIEEQEPVVEPEEVVEPIVEPEPESEPEPEAEEVVGIVTGCARLNVRRRANVTADIVTAILAGTEVKIDMEKPYSGWYKVCTAFGVEGFCMKDYITIKQ